MKLPVTLFDYGVGNIHSLKKAVDAAGAEVSVEEDPDRILNARVLLLPGVGAFSKVAESIAPVREAILQKLEEGLPALGV